MNAARLQNARKPPCRHAALGEEELLQLKAKTPGLAMGSCQQLTLPGKAVGGFGVVVRPDKGDFLRGRPGPTTPHVFHQPHHLGVGAVTRFLRGLEHLFPQRGADMRLSAQGTGDGHFGNAKLAGDVGEAGRLHVRYCNRSEMIAPGAGTRLYQPSNPAHLP